jgi:hypothetical protein
MEQVLVREASPQARPFALFDLIGGRALPEERQGQAHVLQLAIRASVASLGFAAVYGAAAGCTEPMLAVANLVKMPVVVLLGVGSALPIGLLTWKVVGEGTRLSSVAVSLVTGVFTGTLLLACAAPLIALYYLTTDYTGAAVALSAVALAVVLGVGNAFRAALNRRPEEVSPLRVIVPMGAMLGVFMLSLLQLVHLASPILPEETIFDRGVDGILGQP